MQVAGGLSSQPCTYTGDLVCKQRDGVGSHLGPSTEPETFRSWHAQLHLLLQVVHTEEAIQGQLSKMGSMGCSRVAKLAMAPQGQDQQVEGDTVARQALRMASHQVDK